MVTYGDLVEALGKEEGERMTSKELNDDLETIKVSLVNTKPYLQGTRFLVGFQRHIQEVMKEQGKCEKDGHSIEKSVAGGVRIVLFMIKEDVTSMLPRLQPPWRESMEQLVIFISTLQEKLLATDSPPSS